MKWLLKVDNPVRLTGSSTVAVNFDGKDVCEAAAKSHEQAIRQLVQLRDQVCELCRIGPGR